MPANTIDILVREKVLSSEAADRLKHAWVNTVDDLYARIKTCSFANSPIMAQALEEELGIKKGALEGFRKYIEQYASPAIVSAPKPPEYPLGAILPYSRPDNQGQA